MPSFFCITEDFTEDELNNYLQNHFQYTTHFTLRLSISNEKAAGEELAASAHEPPCYINIPKSMMVRYAVRLFEEAKEYAEKIYPDNTEKISAHVIVQEMVHSTVFGRMQTACENGALNETIITIGEGHNADFAERGVPFSIYCHNDTDNILFAYEPDNALVASDDLIQDLLGKSDFLKSKFKNRNLAVKFVADYESDKLYLISVQEISEISHSSDEEIILDTKGITKYYPGVTSPLEASIAMNISHRVISCLLRKIGSDISKTSELADLLEYVNGRLYFNEGKLRRLQEMISLNENTEEFVNRSVRLLFRHIFKEQGLAVWYKRRTVAVRVHKLLEENMKNKKKICGRLEASLENILTAESKISPTDKYIHSVFDDIICSLTECMCATLFNAFYVRINNDIFTRCKPGEKKHRSAVEKMIAGLDYRRILREYHKAFIEKLIEYGMMTGEAFVRMGVFEKAEDILLLTYEETLALKGETLENVGQLFEKRRREQEWYRDMPGFSRLVFSKEAVSAQPGVISFVKSVRENCHIRGSGVISGSVKLPAVVCEENHLPDDCDEKHIYVMEAMPDNISGHSAGGLIIETQDVFADLLPDVAICCFPVVCGAEHCCTLIKNGDLIHLNGSDGEINIKCIANIGK
ncbi:MAG: hypothetical protein IJY74_04520 [Oscillospiraceae bacterium]|nr:hypothetical protein [Oscillospiraceae bacterium]